MQTKLLTAVLIVGLLAFTPSAVAVHGSAYRAYGIATTPANPGVIYHAEVLWTGWSYGLDGFPGRSYVVKITDMSTGQYVTPLRYFLGQEAEYGRQQGNTEVFLYFGRAVDPNINFAIQGIQSITVPTAEQQMVYVGNYDSFELGLVVDGAA